MKLLTFPALRFYRFSRHCLGKLYRLLYRFQARFFLLCSKFILKSQRGNLTLGFDNSSGVDGTGAQIQRLLSVRCLAEFLDCDYQHKPILTVSVHPLDPFQSEAELKQYLVELNAIFYMPSSYSSATNEVFKRVTTLSSFELLKISMKIFLFRDNINLSVLETYPATDSTPQILKRVGEVSHSFYKSQVYANTSRYDVVVHYRQGVGGFAVYPGQKLSRQLPLSYFIDLIHRIQDDIQHRTLNVCVLTDAPPGNMRYKILDSQIANWENAPNIEGGEMKIHGLSFSDLTQIPGIEVEVRVGGNPIEALAIMSKAEKLLIGRSSLSYVGALLNADGEIFFPQDFWHPPMRGWKVCN
jgi:hypothetical protein